VGKTKINIYELVDEELLKDALFISNRIRKELSDWKEIGVSSKAIAIAILFFDLVLQEAKVLSNEERKLYTKYFKKCLRGVDK
jgi:hypothetical protein